MQNEDLCKFLKDVEKIQEYIRILIEVAEVEELKLPITKCSIASFLRMANAHLDTVHRLKE